MQQVKQVSCCNKESKMEDKVKANALLKSIEKKELIKENEILNKMIESMLLKSWQDFHEPIARRQFIRKWKAKIREEVTK